MSSTVVVSAHRSRWWSFFPLIRGIQGGCQFGQFLKTPLTPLIRGESTTISEHLPVAFLGLDIGDRHVGVALATGDELLAVRHSVIDRNKEDFVVVVVALVTKHQVETIVVGWPRNLDGDETAQTTQVQADMVLLQAALPADVRVVTSDETLTSVEARKRLVQAGESLEHEHAEAAKIILEDYLRTNDRKSGR